MEELSPQKHPFLNSPNRTLFFLATPVLISLIAEPVTGLVDTAFVSRMGSVSLAALGVGTMSLSSIFWIFNFLGIGTQTEVSHFLGRQDLAGATRISSLSVILGVAIGLLLVAVGLLSAPLVASLMGATGEVHRQALLYIQIRLFGAPAVLVSIAAFGALRGLQDMHTPLYVAVLINAVNIVLDVLLIFGFGPIPAMGVAGAAAASAASQWIGAVWLSVALYRRLGLPDRLHVFELKKLLQIGGDLFIRTGLLTLFLLLATRTATRIGPEAGAAHQAIRQVWVFTALFLDAFAIAGQSLIGYFKGSQMIGQARRVAFFVCLWSFATGCLLSLLMWFGQAVAIRWFVPVAAAGIFVPAWQISTVSQPLNALSFATDGIHWGTGDYRYLRNVVFMATFCGAAVLIAVDADRPGHLTWIWIITGGWIFIRALLGMLRIWPGIGNSPLKLKPDSLDPVNPNIA